MACHGDGPSPCHFLASHSSRLQPSLRLPAPAPQNGMEMVRLHAMFASHSSNGCNHLAAFRFTRASAPEASRGHAFPVG
eukprot:4540742-Prymnesium_polylepis.1